jgi:DNA damage-binding protein 1
LWALKIASNEEENYDDHLVLSFYGYTKIFSFFGEEFEDVELDGFDLSSQTLHASNVVFGQLVQITSTSIRLIKSKGLVAEWNIAAGELISVATSTYSECLIAQRNQLFYFVIEDEKLTLVKSTFLEHEIACLDMHAFDKDASKISEPCRSNLCAVGLWSDISARLLSLPDLEEIFMEQLKGG